MAGRSGLNQPHAVYEHIMGRRRSMHRRAERSGRRLRLSQQHVGPFRQVVIVLHEPQCSRPRLPHPLTHFCWKPVEMFGNLLGQISTTARAGIDR